jgi:hypothetical protein
MTDTRRKAFESVLAGMGERLSGLADQAVEESRRELARELNQGVRSLRQAPDARTWKETLMDCVARLSRRSVLIRREGDTLRPESARAWGLPPPFPASDAPAIVQAIDSGETMVTARVPGELSAAIAGFGGSDSRRIYVFPVPAAVPAALAVDDPRDVDAIELLTVAAAMALEGIRRQPGSLIQAQPRAEMQAETNAGPGAAARRSSTWEELPRAEREWHLKAQRFARVRVAEWNLRETALVAAGVNSGRLYSALQPHIDAARAQYRIQFMDQPSMADYLHVEILRTLLGEKEERFGDDYPGPLA